MSNPNFTIQIDHYIHNAGDSSPAALALVLAAITNLGKQTMSALSDLQAAVAAEDTVIESAVTLINGIPALIAAAGTDPAALAALQADIAAHAQSLSAAVAANTTPAPPAPAPAAG